MRKIQTLLFLLLVSAGANLHARAKLQGWCENSPFKVSIPGFPTPSTTSWQQAYPGCTVTVYLAGTLTVATIYADNSGTGKANPFTLGPTVTQWFFYANDGRYDVRLSGGGIPAPFTLSDFTLFDTGGSLIDCLETVWCQHTLASPTASVIGITPTASQGYLSIESGSSSSRILLERGSAFGPNGAGTITITAVPGGGGGTGQINLVTASLVATAAAASFSGTMSVTGNVSLNSALTVGGATTVGSLVVTGAGTITGSATFGSLLDITNIANPGTPSIGVTRLFAASGSSSGACSTTIPGMLYYVNSAGVCTGPLGGSSSSSGWNASTTLAGTNALGALTYLGGNNSANQPWALVQNGVEVARLGTNQFFGIGTLADASRKLEVKDTANLIMAQFTGRSSSAEIDFYNTTTLQGSISWSSSGFQMNTVAGVPIRFFPASSLALNLTNGQRVQVNTYLDLMGVADPPAACLAGVGGITYNSTLKHLYFCEDAGSWTQFGTGGTAGWLNGGAANAGLNTDGTDRWIGLLTNHDFNIATNSATVATFAKGGGVGIGTTTPSLKLEVKDTTAAQQLMLTGNTNGTTGVGIQFKDSSIRGQITMTTASLAFSTTVQPMTFFPGTVPTLTLLGGATGRSALGVPGTEFTTGGDHTVTIASSDTDFGKLALFSTGTNSRMTMAVTVAATPVSGGELWFDSNNFNVTTAGHLTAVLNLRTGNARTTGLSISATQAVTIPLTLGVTGTTNLTGSLTANAATFNGNITSNAVLTLAASGLTFSGGAVLNFGQAHNPSVVYLSTIAATSCFSSNVTVTGGSVPGVAGSYIVTPDATLAADGLIWSGRGLGGGLVRVQVCNPTSAGIFLGSGSLYIVEWN